MEAYELELSRRTPRVAKEYSFLSADGVFSKTSLYLPSILLADRVDVSEATTLTVAHGNYGVLPVLLADEAADATITMYDTSARACTLAKENADRNDVDVDVFLDDFAEGDDVDAGFYAVRPYDSIASSRGTVADLVDTVKEGGYVFVAGEKNSGVERVVDEIGSHKFDRIGEEDQALAYAYHVGDGGVEAPAVTSTFTTTWCGETMTFHTSEGLFSKNALDDATRLLGETLTLDEDMAVLDVACGYAPLGALFAVRDGVSVTCSDDDVRATKAASKTLRENDVDGVVRTCDGASVFDSDRFDAVVCNPPTHAGHGVLRTLFDDVRECLQDGGSYYVVVNEGIGIASLLRSSFGSVDDVVRRDGFVVFEAS